MAKTERRTRDNKRDLALDLYLNTDKTQEDICDIVGWHKTTFTENKQKGNWESLKGASTITAASILRKLYLKLEALVDADKLNPDALIKVTKAIDTMSNRKVTLSNHINCAKEFTQWLFAKNPEAAKEFNKYQREFIQILASNGQ